MMTTPAPQPARTRTAVLAMFLCIACHPGGSAKPDSSSMAAVDSSRSADSAYRFLDQPGLPVDSVAAVQARLPYDSISLRRDPCFGTCPMYEVTLYRNGRARYKGLRFVDRIGTWRGEVTIQDYARLSYLLDHRGFMSMPDSFAAASTDSRRYTLGPSHSRRSQGNKRLWIRWPRGAVDHAGDRRRDRGANQLGEGEQ